MVLSPVPVFGFVAPSGSGKTTLLRRLLPILKSRGLRIGYLKHAHHSFDLDRPGKDSFEIREAGADQTQLASTERWALQVENRVRGQGPDLESSLARFPAGTLDLILAEGFKHASYPKIEVHRTAVGEPPLYPRDPDIVAVVTDSDLPEDGHPPVLPLNDPGAVAAFILGRLESAGSQPGDPRPDLIRWVKRICPSGNGEGDLDCASVRLGEWIYGTSEGIAIDELTPDVLVRWSMDPEPVPKTWCGSAIHRAVYGAQTAARAAISGRGVYSLAVTLDGQPFEPPDLAGRKLLGTVPVLSSADGRIPTDARALVAEALARHRIAVVRGLGVYAWGEDPGQACRLIQALERSARIMTIARQAGAV